MKNTYKDSLLKDLISNLQHKNPGLEEGFKEYLASLVTMGTGLPLKAITSNRIEELDLGGQKLLPAQVASLGKALEHNTSLREVKLNKCEIDDEGMKHLSCFN